MLGLRVAEDARKSTKIEEALLDMLGIHLVRTIPEDISFTALLIELIKDGCGEDS